MTWPDWLQPEIEHHRLTNTWGGFLWKEVPAVETTLEQKRRWHEAGAGRQTRAEIAAETEYILGEVEWFLDAKVHPLMIAQTLHRDARAIYKLGQRHHRPAIMAGFSEYSRGKAAA